MTISIPNGVFFASISNSLLVIVDLLIVDFWRKYEKSFVIMHGN